VNTYVKVVFGIVPACFLTVGALMFTGLTVTFFERAMIGAAVIGTIGLIWSLVGYRRRAAAIVLVMLGIGICASLVGTRQGIIIMVGDVNRGGLTTTQDIVVRLLVIFWSMAGPAIVGSIQAWGAVRALRGDRNSGSRSR